MTEQEYFLSTEGIDEVCLLSKLTNAEALSAYLKLDLSVATTSQYTKSFGRRPVGCTRGCRRVPLFIRGASRDPFQVVKLCHWFMFLTNEEQDNVKQKYAEQRQGKTVKANDRAHYKRTVEFLMKDATKGAAVLELDGGYDLANAAGFDLLSNEGYGSDVSGAEDDNHDPMEEEQGDGDGDGEEEEIIEHVGIGSNRIRREAFVQEETNKYNRTQKKRRMDDPATKPGHLCLAKNKKSERNLMVTFAKHLDRTYIPDQPSNAAKRTAMLIFVNEVKDNNNTGGAPLRKNIRRDKIDVRFLVNSTEESHEIFRHVKSVFKDGECSTNYNLTTIKRDGEKSMLDEVTTFIEKEKNVRANPPILRLGNDAIRSDINNRHYVRQGVALTRHSI